MGIKIRRNLEWTEYQERGAKREKRKKGSEQIALGA